MPSNLPLDFCSSNRHSKLGLADYLNLVHSQSYCKNTTFVLIMELTKRHNNAQAGFPVCVVSHGFV